MTYRDPDEDQRVLEVQDALGHSPDVGRIEWAELEDELDHTPREEFTLAKVDRAMRRANVCERDRRDVLELVFGLDLGGPIAEHDLGLVDPADEQ